jgi:hypothetical protein
MRAILFIFVLFSIQANAAVPNQFLGLWHGTGKAWGNGNWNANCDRIEFEGRSNDEEFYLGPVNFFCGDFTNQWLPFTFVIKNNELWQNDAKVGAFSSATLHAETIDKKSGFKIVFDLTSQGDMILYYERWFLNGNDQPFFHAHGELVRN